MRLPTAHGVALILLAGASLLSGHSAPAQEQRPITIGTEGITGVYYLTGGAICRMVSKDRGRHGIRCSAESTGGSVYNIDTMRAGELDMAIVQSDLREEHPGRARSSRTMVRSTACARYCCCTPSRSPWSRGRRRDRELRRPEGAVNVGNPGLASSTMEMLMAAKGWTMNDFALVSELKSAEQAQALCEDKIDARCSRSATRPARSRRRPLRARRGWIPVTGLQVDLLLAQNPFDEVGDTGRYVSRQ